MTPTAMPETPVNKDHDTADRENKVRFADQRNPPPPSSDGMLSKDANQSDLSGSVATRPNLPHNA